MNWEKTQYNCGECNIPYQICDGSSAFCDKDMDMAYERGIRDCLIWLYCGCFDNRFADLLHSDIGDVNSVLDTNCIDDFKSAASKIADQIQKEKSNE